MRLFSALSRVLGPVDRALQRVFDAIFMRLMRAGVPKKRIRYSLWGSFAVFYVLSLYSWFMDPYMAVLGVLFGALHLYLYGGKMQSELELDEMAERRGLPSFADSDFARMNAKLIGCVFIALCIGTPLVLAVGGTPKFLVNDVGRFISGLSALAAGYLCRTPPTKPETKVPSLLANSPQPG